MKLIWYTVLIRAIPESLGLILICLAVIKEKRTIKDILKSSIICGLAAFSLRMLPLKFGIHAFLLAIISSMLMNFILKIKLHKAFLGILASLAVLTITEVVVFALLQYILKLDLQAVYSNAVTTLLAGIPSILLLYLIAFIIFKLNKTNNVKEEARNVNQ